MSEYYTIRWQAGVVSMLDQRLLPQEVVYREYRDYHELSGAIREMVIRGAPAIGAAAAYGLALAAVHSPTDDLQGLRQDLETAAAVLLASRPTAVNLSWALRRVLSCANDPDLNDVEAVRQAVIAQSILIAEEDVRFNQRMGLNGQSLIPQTASIIHHCNTGALATVGYGTALGVVRAAHEHGKHVHVFVDETRPRLQGARLTAWELGQLGIPHTVIADGASGYFMRSGKVDLCLVGCDRIAANGDTANKIGTYNLALAAHAHGLPFYVVGPTSTVDLRLRSGDEIPIEERPARELTHIGDCQITPADTQVGNPAFDITPAGCITAIITEAGIAYPPFEDSLRQCVTQARQI